MKKILCIFMVFLLSLSLAGCEKENVEPGDPFVYYLNMEGTAIEKRAFEWEEDVVEKEIELLLSEMKNPSESGKYRSVIPEAVIVQSFKLDGQKVDLYFNQEYTTMDAAEEVLCRAGIVQTLVQLEQVELVQFYVENQPLKQKDGNPIGYMNEDEFVQNTGESLSSFKQITLQLYLPNGERDRLEKVEKEFQYNSNISVEKLIVEVIMRESGAKNELAFIPQETKLLGVTVKDGICYVNFDENFLNSNYMTPPELTIYGIVNSIVENGSAEKVQISVDGDPDVMFQNQINLSKPFSPKWSLVEE